MKEKVLFMVINMNIGGTEKSLLNLIEEKMPEEQYDITILMLEKYGGFLDHIPKRVNVRYLENYKYLKGIINNPPRKTLLNLIKKKQIIKSIILFIIMFISKLTQDNSLFFKYLLKGIPIYEKEYDIAIAYAGPMDFISYFVIHKIRAKKKYQWIHFDVTKVGFNKKFATNQYKKFNKVYVVSEEGKNKLVDLIPGLRDRIATFHNIISPRLIMKMADDSKGFDDNFNGIRVLTVGRLSKEKGQDLAISVLEELKQLGFNIRWYCIGEGNARQEYEKLIKNCSLEDDFILLGSTANPYPYMKQCDVYVQPSRYEGHCLSIEEAKCFNKPIVCAPFNGAIEQLANYSNGSIVKFDKNEMVKQIKDLLYSSFIRQKYYIND